MTQKAAVLFLALGLGNLEAQDWPRWRGADGNAISPESPLPLRWSESSSLRWKAAIPGEGASSPIVCGDLVFLTSSLEDGTRRILYCLDRATGRIRWQRETRDADPERASALTGHAAATPAAEDGRVVAFFGNAGASCYDFSGETLWRWTPGQFDSELGLASSPIFYRGKVFLVCDHDGDRSSTFDSFLIALDAKTGKPVWKTDRPGLGRSWSTPILIPAGGRRVLVVSGQDALRGYDPDGGGLCWEVKGLSSWVTPSPVFGAGLLFATSGKDGPTLAVRLGDRQDGNPQVVWRDDRGGPYVCSPLVYQDFLYVGDEGGQLTCREAPSGKLSYRRRLKGKFTASPVAGEGRIYWTNEEGTTYVIRAGGEFGTLAENRIEGECLASPAIAGGALFLRTREKLYCIETPRGN